MAGSHSVAIGGGGGGMAILQHFFCTSNLAVESEIVYKYNTMSVMFLVMGGEWHVFKTASLPVKWVQTLYFWRTKDLRTEQVDHFILPK